jgi:hypothetical protein
MGRLTREIIVCEPLATGGAIRFEARSRLAVLGAGADRTHPRIEDGLLTRGDDPVQSAGAEHAARQALELGGHALLKCRAPRWR